MTKGTKGTGLLAEDTLSLEQASEQIKAYTGRKPDKSTVYRWAKRGCWGVKLEHVRVGGRIITSKQALMRFINSAAPIPPTKYSNREVLHDELLAHDSSAICFDGYDDAVVGAIFNGETWVSVYSYGLIIKQLEDDGMAHDEAVEFAEYNVIPSIPDDGPIVLDMYITPTGEVID